jgi:hypothetical protein
MQELAETHGALKDTPIAQLSDDRLRGKRGENYLKKIRKAW